MAFLTRSVRPTHQEDVVAADDTPSAEPGPFDVRTLRQLIAMMSRHDLNEIDLQDGTKRIRVRRGLRGGGATVPVVIPTPIPVPAPAANATTAPTADQAGAGTARPGKPTVPIKSPGVGTFYAASKPGAEPFVRVGSRVTPTTTVGILEAMKIMNEIPAECSGVITEVLVQNQQPVEFGQVLFHVDPAG